MLNNVCIPSCKPLDKSVCSTFQDSVSSILPYIHNQLEVLHRILYEHPEVVECSFVLEYRTQTLVRCISSVDSCSNLLICSFILANSASVSLPFAFVRSVVSCLMNATLSIFSTACHCLKEFTLSNVCVDPLKKTIRYRVNI